MLLALKGDQLGEGAAIEPQLKIEGNLSSPKLLCMALDARAPADSLVKRLSSMMEAASWERLSAYAKNGERPPTLIVMAQSATLTSAEQGTPAGALPRWTVIQGVVKTGEKVFLIDTVNPAYIHRSGYVMGHDARAGGCLGWTGAECVAGALWKEGNQGYGPIYDLPSIFYLTASRKARPINMARVRPGSVVCEGGPPMKVAVCKVGYDETVYLRKWLDAKSVALGGGFLSIDQERATILRRWESHLGKAVFERLLSGHLARGLPKTWVQAVTGSLPERPTSISYENGDIVTTYNVHGMTLTFSDGVLSAWSGDLRP